MAYVKLIRESFEKTTCEILNMRDGVASGETADKILLSGNPYSNGGGYRITQEDLEYLYQRKKRDAEDEADKRKTEEQKALDKKLNELAILQEEMRKSNKKFPRCVIKKIFG